MLPKVELPVAADEFFENERAGETDPCERSEVSWSCERLAHTARVGRIKVSIKKAQDMVKADRACPKLQRYNYRFQSQRGDYLQQSYR